MWGCFPDVLWCRRTVTERRGSQLAVPLWIDSSYSALKLNFSFILECSRAGVIHKKKINTAEVCQLKHVMPERRTEFQLVNFKLLTEKGGENGSEAESMYCLLQDLSSIPSTGGRELIPTCKSSLQGIRCPMFSKGAYLNIHT